jgi:RHS repeat-associated protein
MPQTDSDQTSNDYAAAWVPTHDPVRDQVLTPNAARAWTPTGLNIFGHTLGINVLTGGLTVSTTDLSLSYYSFPFQIRRTLDSQEQHVQASYLRSHPNSDRRYHFFGNWQFQREAQVSATWDSIYPELLVADGDGESTSYSRDYPDFSVNTLVGPQFEERLRAYGVPGRTLSALRWIYSKHDCLLRTKRGSFSLLAGRYNAETLVDPVDLRLWRFEPVTGMAYLYSSEFAYQRFIDTDGLAERTVQSLLTQTTDAIGHTLQIQPVSSKPPYRSYRLVDGIGRRLRLDLRKKVTFRDVNSFGGKAKVYLVSKAVDESSKPNRLVRYKYAHGRLVSVHFPGHAGGADRIVKYTYDDSGNLIRITDPTGDYITITYFKDMLDSDEQLIPRLKVSKIADLEGNSVTYSYRNPDKLTTVEFSGPTLPSKSVSYRYLQDDNDTKQRYLASESTSVSLGYSGNQLIQRTSTYSADGRFLLIGTTDPLGNVSSLEYNDFNQVTASVDALGHRREYQYDVQATATATSPNRFDLLTTSENNTDSNGSVFLVKSTQTFLPYKSNTSDDPADSAQSTHRVSSARDANGNSTAFGYDAANSGSISPTLIVDPFGKKTRRTFSSSGQLVKLVDALGSTWVGKYNSCGQLIQSTDPNGFQSFWVFDAGSGWLTASTDALGSSAGDPAHSIFYQRNDSGLVIGRTDAVGDKAVYNNYRNQRVRSVTQYGPATRQVLFEYEPTGSLTAITDPLGRKTSFLHDEAGRIYEIGRTGSPPMFLCTRDLAGRVTSITEQSGKVTSYTYDSLGRVTSLEEPAWSDGVATYAGKNVGFKYDPLSHLLRIDDSELPGPILFSYDPFGNVAERTDAFGSQLVYFYDARNTLVRLVGLAGAVDLQFGRNANGDVISVRDSAFIDKSRLFTFLRKQNGLVDNLYGISVDASGISTQFSYDNNRRLLAVSHTKNSAPLLAFRYTNRADGFLGGVVGGHEGTYTYDGLKQITGESDSSVETAYDGASNIISRSGVTLPTSQQNQYDSDNKLLSSPVDGLSFDYDGNGNMVKKHASTGTTVYVFDGANRLARVDDGVTVTNYTYDIFGNVVQRVATSGGKSALQRYFYGGTSILARLTKTNVVSELYTRDPDGRLLRRRSNKTLSATSSKDTHSLFYLADGLASICRLADWDGKVIQTLDYDAWGASVAGTAVGGEMFRYRSGYFDPVPGAIKFGSRWYDPQIRRWISQDPVARLLAVRNVDASNYVSEMLNLYAYCNNSPLSVSDATGFGPIQWLVAKLGNFANAVVVAAKLAAQEIGPPNPQEVADENKTGTEESSSGKDSGDDPPAGPPPDPNLSKFLQIVPIILSPLLFLLLPVRAPAMGLPLSSGGIQTSITPSMEAGATDESESDDEVGEEDSGEEDSGEEDSGNSPTTDDSDEEEG